MYLFYLLYSEIIFLILNTNTRSYLNEYATSTPVLIRSMSFIAYYSCTTLLSSVIARGWPWMVVRHPLIHSLISICNRTRGENRMESMWVKARTGRPVGSYHHGENEINLGIINLIWSKIGLDSQKRKQSETISFHLPMFSQALLLHCWLLLEEKKLSHFLSPLFLCFVSCRQCKREKDLNSWLFSIMLSSLTRFSFSHVYHTRDILCSLFCWIIYSSSYIYVYFKLRNGEQFNLSAIDDRNQMLCFSYKEGWYWS